MTKTCRFGDTQGPGHFRFHDGATTTMIEIGYLLDDDGPYKIEITVRPTNTVIHVDKPTDDPSTCTVQR